MAGLFGILDSTTHSDVNHFVREASARLSHFSWYAAKHWIAPDAPVALGQIGIGILNREAQPVISADGRFVLFMTGELYRTADLWQQLDVDGFYPRNTSGPELALTAFQAYGSEFAKVLEGAFFIVVYDRLRRRLVLTNDRFGLYPHFYAQQRGRLAFAPEVKGVLCAPFVERKLNPVAVSEYFRFQQLIGAKTFHEGVLYFPYASVGEFDLETGDLQLRHYWDWDAIPDRSKLPFDEAVRETGRLLRQAVTRLTEDKLRPGVFLSGGLDSRTILGLMPKMNPPPVTATFGADGCRDQYYAEWIAKTVGSRHFWFDLPNGQWVLDNADLHLKLTEGFHAWMHMHGITMLPHLRDVMDYDLTGWAGEFPLGYPMIAGAMLHEPVDRYALLQELFYRLNQTHSWPGITEAEARLVYTPEYRKQALGLAFESMVEEYKPYERFRIGNQVDYFFLVNHCGRMTGNMIKIVRSHLEVRFPFWDYRFIDFVYSLDSQVRQGNPRGKLYMHLITREIPQLVMIPYDKDELLPTSDERLRTLQSWSVRIRRQLGLLPNRATLYADYENYLRNDLRSWAEGILFDKRTEERGILNIPFVHSLFERHMNRQEEWTIGKLAPLMTFEMMMREYFD